MNRVSLPERNLISSDYEVIILYWEFILMAANNIFFVEVEILIYLNQMISLNEMFFVKITRAVYLQTMGK